VEALKRNGRLYWLRASVEIIASRIRGDDQRPSLTGGRSFIDEIAEVLAQREEKSRAASDEAIDTDGLSVEQVAERIILLTGAK
jgi:shikimate kinase